MLTFQSSSARSVDSRRAIATCLEAACGTRATEVDLLLIHAGIGHDFKELADEAALLAPNARIFGASCSGVVGREGVSESMKDVALMAVSGRDFAVAHVDGINGRNSAAQARRLAAQIRRQRPDVTMVFLMTPGIDIDNDACVAAIESELGSQVTIFGATSSDNMRGIVSYQICDRTVYEHAAWMVGFADPTLEVDTQASHGFVAFGEPLVVTKAKDNRIVEINGRPAWSEYTRLLGVARDATCGDTIPIGALAEALPFELAEEYGNGHLLRVVTRRDEDGTMYYTTSISEGTKLWLTIRDEERIFADLDRMMARMKRRLADAEVVAVFHADCLARGRYIFQRIVKEELVARMQGPLSDGGIVPPWLGMYGFGEFARVADRNIYHNYTTAIYALYRRNPQIQIK